jgi:hypothetical protein
MIFSGIVLFGEYKSLNTVFEDDGKEDTWKQIVEIWRKKAELVPKVLL